MSQPVELRLTLRISYQPNGTPVAKLKENLADLLAFAFADGLITGSTTAEVLSHETRVEEYASFVHLTDAQQTELEHEAAALVEKSHRAMALINKLARKYVERLPLAEQVEIVVSANDDLHSLSFDPQTGVYDNATQEAKRRAELGLPKIEDEEDKEETEADGE